MKIIFYGILYVDYVDGFVLFDILVYNEFLKDVLMYY